MISVLLVAASTIKAQNPIPSYNVPVAGKATFQETPTIGVIKYTDEKRDINVQNNGGGTSAPQGAVITVVIYRLDMSQVLGPYSVQEGQTLSIQIDNQRWGVAAQSNYATTMSVWTSDNQ